MAIPYRGNTGLGTYFITSATSERKSLFQSETMASLLVGVLFDYRDRKKYLLHEFVIMPNHFHLILTPAETLERALQLIKGGFSFRAKKELGFGGEIWETSFHDRRIRHENEFLQFREYIHCSPVRAGLSEKPEKYPYCSAAPAFVLDAIPQRLKPMSQAG